MVSHGNLPSFTKGHNRIIGYHGGLEIGLAIRFSEKEKYTQKNLMHVLDK